MRLGLGIAKAHAAALQCAAALVACPPYGQHLPGDLSCVVLPIEPSVSPQDLHAKCQRTLVAEREVYEMGVLRNIYRYNAIVITASLCHVNGLFQCFVLATALPTIAAPSSDSRWAVDLYCADRRLLRHSQ